MALEKRGDNLYYYRKERDGNRVFSKYYGKGKVADLIAQMDEMERERKQIKILEDLKFKQKSEEIDREIILLESKITDLITKTLLSLGFYKTKSREWRLKAK